MAKQKNIPLTRLLRHYFQNLEKVLWNCWDIGCFSFAPNKIITTGQEVYWSLITIDTIKKCSFIKQVKRIPLL